MNSKRKYIGLNQRISFDVLDAAIHFYLTDGVIDNKYVFQKMLEFISGVNRANKAAGRVCCSNSNPSITVIKSIE